MTSSAFFPNGRRLLTLAAVSLVAVLLSASPAAGSCNTTCTTTANGKNCAVSQIGGCFVAGMTVTCGISATMVIMTSNATCSVGTTMDLMATAMHMSTAPPTASCQFRFELHCGATVGCATTARLLEFCFVTQTDGLPVELMEFSVEDGDEADTEGEDASD